MISLDEFPQDSEFRKLITRHPHVDLVRISLEFARDVYDELDFQPTLKWIEDRIEELRGPLARIDDSVEALERIAYNLAEIHALRGDQSAYDKPESSYLNRVVETGQGIPISLAIVYMGIANPLGVTLEGVSAPMHFLMRHDAHAGPVFLDAFAGGRIFDEEECLDWLEGVTQLPRVMLRGTLQPSNSRSIVMRQLNNLKTLYARRNDWSNAWKVQRRLSLLSRNSFEEHRDSALIALRSHQPGKALNYIHSCLRSRSCTRQDREKLLRYLAEAQCQLSRWN